MKKTRRSHAKSPCKKGPPPAALQSANSAAKKRPLSKTDLEMLEALGFL